MQDRKKQELRDAGQVGSREGGCQIFRSCNFVEIFNFIFREISLKFRETQNPNLGENFAIS